MKNLSVFLTVLLAGMVVPTQAQSTQSAPQAAQPTPPAFVMERIRRFGNALEKSMAGQPSRIRMKQAEYTDHVLWSIGWLLEKGGFAVTMDQVTGRVVEYDDDTGDAAVADAVRAERDLPVTRDQAEAAVRAMLLHANAAPGDWRLGNAELAEWDGNSKTWKVGMWRYADGKPCELDRAYARVSPLDGSIQLFALNDYGIRLPQVFPLIDEARARRIAKSAWEQFGGPSNIEPTLQWDGPGWKALSSVTPLCRLAYAFYFHVKGENGGPIYGATVDAQTGELWGIGILTGGGGKFTSRPVPGSSRMTLATGLAKSKNASALARAVAAGTLLKAVKPASAKARRLRHRVGERDVEFAWTQDKRELIWSEASGGWAGVRLSPDEATLLETWLKSRPD